MRKRINVGDILFDSVTMDQALTIMEERINVYKQGEKTALLLVANQDTINRIPLIENMSIDGLNEASFLTIPDGYSIIYGAKYLKTPLPERVTGPDLMVRFMELAAEKGYTNFFLGAGEGVAQRMADSFCKTYPGLKISGIYSPPYGPFSDGENEKMISMINESGAQVVWVSFGCPKQETWIVENLEKIKAPICAGVGAAFDFHSGNTRRAPRIIQNMRLEWFFRLLQEPRRLWKRYLSGGVHFYKVLKRQRKNRQHGQIL